MKILKTINYKKLEKEAYVPAYPTYMGNATKWEKSDYPTGECGSCGKTVMKEYLKKYNGKCRSCFEKEKINNKDI